MFTYNCLTLPLVPCSRPWSSLPHIVLCYQADGALASQSDPVLGAGNPTVNCRPQGPET